MKKLAYLLSMLLIVSVLSLQTADAQNVKTLSKKDQKRIEKLRKEKERNMKRAVSRIYYMELLKKNYFVFQADYMTTPDGNSVVVDPDLNFLTVNGRKVLVQFGFDGAVGWNGVGGITARGELMGNKFYPGKKNDMSVTATLSLTGISFQPQMTLNVSDDGTGQLVLQLADGRTVTLFGKVVAPKKAQIFIGQSIY